MASSFDYRGVGLGIRPPRVAVIIDEHASWSNLLGLVSTLTGVWGGSAHAIVPTDGTSIPTVFRALLKRYDPDWFVRFGDTWISNDLSNMLYSDYSSLARTRGQIGRLDPDHRNYPLNTISSWLTGDQDKQAIVSPKVIADALTRILIYSTTGFLSDNTRSEIVQYGIDVEDCLVNPARGQGVLPLISEIWEFGDKAKRSQYPFDLNAGQLLTWLRGDHDIDGYPLVIVQGATAADFAYFWTLRAMRSTPIRSNTYWVPFTRSDGVAKRKSREPVWRWMCQAIVESVQNLHIDRRVLVTSLSTDSSQLQDLLSSIRRNSPIPCLPLTERGDGSLAWINTPGQVTVAPDDLDQLLPYELKYWEKENWPGGNRTIVQFMDGKGMAVLNSPKPQDVSVEPDRPIQWVIEASVDNLRLPALPTLTDLVVDANIAVRARVSSLGVSYLAVSDYLEYAGPSRLNMVTPSLKLPSDQDIFRAILAGRDLQLRPSDKGNYEDEFIRKMGSLESAARELQDHNSVRTLLKFVDGSNNRHGIFDEGVHIQGQRGRYLDLRAVMKICGFDGDSAAHLLDHYLNVGLVSRGVLIKCPVCLCADWYSMAELGDTAVCHRCRREHTYTSKSDFYFKLDELVTLFIEQNSYCSVLALNQLRVDLEPRLMYTNACKIWNIDQSPAKDKARMEVDFIAIAKNQLIIGEAKAAAKPQREADLNQDERQQLKDYVGLCQDIRPDQLVIATNSYEWGRSTLCFFEQLAARLADCGTHLAPMTGADLGWPESPDAEEK